MDTPKEDFLHTPERSISRRDFLRFCGAGAIVYLVPQTIRNAVELIVNNDDIEEEFPPCIIETVLSDRYILRDGDREIEIPIRDDVRMEDGYLVYTLPFEVDDLPQIPAKPTQKEARDNRQYYPLTAFYFYPGSSARFDKRYLTGQNDWSRPSLETKTPLIEYHEENLPHALNQTLDMFEIQDERIRQRKNIIISVFSDDGFGRLFVYKDGEMILNSRISGRRGRGTTMGIYPDIIPYEPWRTSRRYDHFPMPYAMHYGSGGEFIHAGNTRGFSHGCTRMEGIKSAALWRLVMHTKDNPEESFMLINIKDSQKGSDLSWKNTDWRALGYRSAFQEKIHIIESRPTEQGIYSNK